MPTPSRAAGALLTLLPGAGLTCSDARGDAPSLLLAHRTLRSTAFRDDTVVACVALTTVAEQDVVPADDGWMVCNGIGFGDRGADSFARWTPEGSSYARARALADSVRKAQP